MSKNKEKFLKLAIFINSYESCGTAFSENLCVELLDNYCYLIRSFKSWEDDDYEDNFLDEQLSIMEEELDDIIKNIVYVDCGKSVITLLIKELKKNGFEYDFPRYVRCHIFKSDKEKVVISYEKDAFVYNKNAKNGIVEKLYNQIIASTKS